MPASTRELETTACWRPDSWLGRCEGYRVFAREEPIGYVEEIVLDADGEPAELVVRVGEVFSHRLTVPAGAVELLDPAGERLFIGTLSDLGGEAFGRQLRIPAAG
jgi:hypothetical protein